MLYSLKSNGRHFSYPFGYYKTSVKYILVELHLVELHLVELQKNLTCGHIRFKVLILFDDNCVY